MYLLDVLLDTLTENLALDEALLLQAEQGGPEVLRLWEWSRPAVVLGAGCKLADDVDEPACRAADVPLLRRASGGGTVLLGPGCLLFSLILSYRRDARLEHVRPSFGWILDRIVQALSPLGIQPERAGISDLTLNGRKVSGNSQQRKRTHVLHHGTLLYQFDGAAVARFLHAPLRQPDYRGQRSHGDFLGNLPASAAELKRLLGRAWEADERLPTLPSACVRQLVEEKYGQVEWLRRR